MCWTLIGFVVASRPGFILAKIYIHLMLNRSGNKKLAKNTYCLFVVWQKSSGKAETESACFPLRLPIGLGFFTGHRKFL